jgi:DNA-binding MarR family transcriptional regulator
MKNYRNILRAASVKYAYEVLKEIDNSGGSTFKELMNKTQLSEYTLRRITNRLSRVGIIKSVKGNSEDKRERLFVIVDSPIIKRVVDFIFYFEE